MIGMEAFDEAITNGSADFSSLKIEAKALWESIKDREDENN